MKGKKLQTKAIIAGILLVLVLVVNITCVAYFNIISLYFDKPEYDTKSIAAAEEKARGISERISAEGMVLLENKNQALPLDMKSEKETNINVFGVSCVDPFYSPESSAQGNETKAVTVTEGLKNAGITVNPELYQFYYDSKYKNESSTVFGQFDVDYVKRQVPLEEYPEELWEETREYSDVAVVFLSRIGAEGFEDVPESMEEYGGAADEHYLELSQTERELLDKVKSLNFDKNIVLLNTGAPMECGFLEEDWIDAAMWIGYGGEDGMNALGGLLSGVISPSGRLTDTYAYDAMSSVAYENYGFYHYSNVSTDFVWAMTGEKDNPYGYLDYSEGIYVGYRYYETRWVDNETGEVNEAEYGKQVQYPFGYGLSYTEFKQEIVDMTEEDGMLTVVVNVKNTGNADGKDVVQLYYTPPYTIGGIEKSHVNLVEFGKTGILAPGESENVTLSFRIEDMASFDYLNHGCYVLEKGEYEIKLMANAHEVIDSRIYTVDLDVVYDETNKRESDMTAAVSQFKDIEGDQIFVSRADWEGTWPDGSVRERKASDEIVEQLTWGEPYEDPGDKDIIIKDNGLKLSDLIGAEYDDPKWDLLLEQLSVEDMQTLIGMGGYATQMIKSVEKPFTIDQNGPGGVFSLINDTMYQTVGYPVSVLVASTWNIDLIEEMATAFGAEADAWGVSGLYAPALNIHRTPFNGRNAEYYSECPVLTGKCAAAFIRGVQSQGLYCYAKHFGLYEQAANTEILCTWINEQALREIYLRGFEVCVKEGGTKAIMSCYNKIGAMWSGACKPLLETVLRDEWGFRGMVITDGYQPSMNPDAAIRNGCDMMLDAVGTPPEDSGSTARQAMRRASKNILYTVANSNAMEFNDMGPSASWFYALLAVDAVVVGVSVWILVHYYKIRRKRS